MSSIKFIVVVSALALSFITFTFYNSAPERLLRQAVEINRIYDINYYSKASYCSLDKLLNWDCGEECLYHPKMQNVQAYNDLGKEAQGYCGYNPEKNQIVVGFRGTSFFKNWLSDFEAFPVSFPDCDGCKIHMGFRNHLEPIQDQIVECVKNQLNKYKNSQIIITGHSLGGAMATLAAIPIRKLVSDPDQIYLYTFGAPRVGNKLFATYMNKLFPNSFRVVNYHDIVPHVPFKTLLNFNHHGFEVWMTKEDSSQDYKVCYTEEGESIDCAYSLSPINFSVKNHLNYFGIYTGCNSDLPQKAQIEQQNELMVQQYKKTLEQKQLAES